MVKVTNCGGVDRHKWVPANEIEFSCTSENQLPFTQINYMRNVKLCLISRLTFVGWGLVCWNFAYWDFAERGVSWSIIDRSRVSWGGVCDRRVLGLSFVRDIGGVSVAVGLVVDDLSTAVWEFHAVRSCDHFPIATLSMRVVVVGFILNRPFETIWLRILK